MQMISANVSATICRTRDDARQVARNVNTVAPAKLKAPVKQNGVWMFPGVSHADNKGTLKLKK